MSPFYSRCAAMLMGIAAVMHSLVAFDLVLHFLPDTPELRALWAVGAMVKGLWLAFVMLGLATAFLLYRAPLAGFLLSLVASGCLYFASVGLWQDVKGGFWFAVAANVLAAVGAWQAAKGNLAQQGLKLSWSRFAFCILLLSAFPALLIASSISDRDSWWALGAVLSVLVSILVFAGFGWARLRRANAASPIDVGDIAQILQHFLGPAIPAVVWLALTFLLPFAIILVWFLTRAA